MEEFGDRILLLVISFIAIAVAELHLLFHIGLGQNGDYFVDGTLENKGDQEVYQGYIVFNPLSINCYPKSPQLWPFGNIAANSKFEFKVPMGDKLEGYKLDMGHAMDSFGNKINFIMKPNRCLILNKLITLLSAN